MLTYESLQSIMGQEKATKKPSKLPEEFFREVRNYLENKARMSKGQEDAWELDSARRLLQDILEMREGKILSLALFSVRSGVEPENLTPEEEDFFNALVSAIKSYQSSRRLAIEGEQAGKEVVALLQDVPQFVGTDMKTYGPYSKGDIVTLPSDVAVLLSQKKVAKGIQVA